MSEATFIHEVKSFTKTFFSIHNLEELTEGIDELHLHILSPEAQFIFVVMNNDLCKELLA